MKNIGVVLSASSIIYSRISVKVFFESISTNYSPYGKATFINYVRAFVILSGLRHLRTKSFLNGIFYSFFQSNGRFSSSGDYSLYQSLNLFGASFSIF